MDLKDYDTEKLQVWLQGLKISEKSLKAIASLKMIGEELVDAQLDELIDDGVSPDDAKLISHGIQNFKPEEIEEPSVPVNSKAEKGIKKNLDLVLAEKELKAAEQSYKDLSELKKALSSLGMPVGCIMRCKDELKGLSEEKKGPVQKRFTMHVKKRDNLLKKLRKLREKYPEGSDNWNAITEVHEGSMQVVSKHSNFSFGKMLTTHTSRIFKEQRQALASIKECKKKIASCR